jgi:methionyl-tRNA formyltransferase
MIVFLTIADPLYLYGFFDRVLGAVGDDAIVFVVPPLYRNQRFVGAAWRYLRTFGLISAVRLGVRVLAARARHGSFARLCKRHGVDCRPVKDVNDPAFIDRLRALDTDLIVSVSCPQLFRKPLLDVPARGCLGVHGAILPDYRGIMPSFWMLAEGERQAGVSVFYLDEGIDTGLLCGQRVFDVEPGESLDHFVRRSKEIAAGLLVDVLRDIREGTVSVSPLDLSEGSYYSWPTRADVRRFALSGHKLW